MSTKGLLKRIRKQTAVYWPFVGTNDFGEPIYGEPEEIKCRWEDISEIFKTAAGDDTVSNSKVIVDRDTPEGGVLWLGTMDSLDDQINPMNNPGAYAIRKFSKIPDRKAKEFLRTATL